MDMKEITALGVTLQAKLDEQLTAARKTALALAEVTENGVEAGMVRPLEGKLIINEAYAVAGAVSNAAVLAAALHIKQTKACVANDCDTGSVSSVAGIAVITPKSGGR